MKIYGNAERLNHAACYAVFQSPHMDAVLGRFRRLDDAIEDVHSRERRDIEDKVYRTRMGWVDSVDLPEYVVIPEEEDPLYRTLILNLESEIVDVVKD